MRLGVCVLFGRFVNGCTKEQLMQIAEHYKINVTDKKRKAEVKGIILSALAESGVLEKRELLSDANIRAGVCTQVGADLCAAKGVDGDAV